MNLKYIYIAIAAICFASCEPLEEITNDLDKEYMGPKRKDIEYELIKADYNVISADIENSALNPEDIEDAKFIKDNEALLPGYSEDFLAALVSSKEELAGFAIGSQVEISYQIAEDAESEIKDTVEYFLRKSQYAWTLYPGPAYFYDFEDGIDYETISYSGWANYSIGKSTDRDWVYRSYNNNRYAQITAFGGEGNGYDIWMVSPMMDLDNVVSAKNLMFETSMAYWNGAELKVYIMDAQDPSKATLKEELTATLADNASNNYVFVESGEISLDEYSGEVYIGFQYVAGSGQTTTFQIDNVTFDYIPE